MLRALLEAGIRPDLIVGTSVGALNGAYLAGHAELASMDGLAALWTSIRRRDVFPVSVPGLASGLLGRRNFLFASLGLRKKITRAELGFSRLEDAPFPAMSWPPTSTLRSPSCPRRDRWSTRSWRAPQSPDCIHPC